MQSLANCFRSFEHHPLPKQGRTCGRLRAAESPATRCRASTQTEQRGESLEIQNLQPNCNQFECTSSPSVEKAVKRFANDVARCKAWHTSLFAEGVKYQGGPRSFTGNAKYNRMNWAQDSCKDYKTEVVSMEMVGQDTAKVRWRLSGQLGMFAFRGSVVSTLEMNPLTGRIVKHVDEYSFSESNPLANAAVTAHRLAWATKQNARDTGETVDRVLDSMSSMDEDDIYKSGNPQDAGKFFQDNTRATNFNDAVSYATFLAILWGLWQAYSTLDGF